MQDREVLDYIKQAFDLKNQGCYKHAVEMLYKALSEANDNLEILFQLGELYKLLHNYERALQYLEKVLVRDANHLAALKCVKDIYIKQEQYKKAEKYAKKIFDLESSADNLSSLIKIYGKLKKFDEIKEFKGSSLINEKVLYECALTCFENGEYTTAKEIINNILETSPDNENAMILLGRIYFNVDEFDKAKEIFSRFGKNTENPEILNYRGLFALDEMNFVEAIKCFSKASSADKLNSGYFYNLGNAYFFNGWIEESTKAYLNAICLSPENLDYRYSLSYLYYENKEFDKAQKEVDFILEKDKNHLKTKVLNALLKVEKKDLLGAKNDLEDVLKVDKNDDFAHSSLAKVYSDLLIHDKAVSAISEVIERNPDSLSYLCDYAGICVAAKNYDKALELVEQITDKNENYIEAYVLGAQAACEKKDYDTAKDYAQRAISLDINCSQGYYYLSLVRFETSDFEEAVECMKRAIMYDVTNPKYYAGMSEIYKASGDVKSALEYIKEAESISGAQEYKIMYKELASLNRKSQKICPK